MPFENNPLYSSQWHLFQLGDLERIWQDYSGAGVDVAVFDDGTEASHEDLSDNYDPTLSYSGIGDDNGGQPSSTTAGHGTAVAGIIASSNNNVGGVGVAWGASIVGVNYLDELQFQGFAVDQDALRSMVNYDVVNNSWGRTPDYGDGQDIFDAFSGSNREWTIYNDVVANGRDGLGTIIVKAAGNDNNDSQLELSGVFGNAQGEGVNSSHSLISVAATTSDGFAAWYSNWGASILISAPAASVTTDLGGTAGYDNSDYTTSFGGTSAAAPVISGVVALILEANPDLGWRDVQNILAASASQTGSNYGGPANALEESAWFSNGAGNWNGGGYSFNLSYGFGLVDAFAAVRMAEVWTEMFGGSMTSANQTVESASYSGPAVNIADNSSSVVTFSVTEDMLIEHLYVTIDISHTFIGDLTLELTSPDGTTFLLFANEGAGTQFDDDYTFGVRGLLDTNSSGEWSIRVTDSATQDTGVLRDVTLDFYGREATNDTVHHITSDYFTSLATVETARRTITDEDGGIDWLNLVALQDDVTVSLSANGSLEMQGQTIEGRLSNGQEIENLALGDGNDVANANESDNTLFGGRGNDALSGQGGADTLFGGEGNDVLTGEGIATSDIASGQTIYRLYQATLGRAPDPGGLQDWVSALAGGQSLVQIVSGFVNSTEFQNTYGSTSDVEFVTLLYRNVLNRAPDQAGLDDWTNRLSTGQMSREEVVLGFSQSGEFRNATAVDSIRLTVGDAAAQWTDDVFRLYQATLDRAPDFGGLEGWMNALATGADFLGVVDGFIQSAEFQNTYGATDNDTFVTLLYQNVLNRAPDAGGLASWLNRLESEGWTRADVVNGFSQSNEFINNTADNLTAYIVAQGQDDTLEGGAGDDILYGGSWTDHFVFNAADGGSNVIADFEAWDRVELSGTSFVDGGEVLASIAQDGADAVLQFNGLEVVFENIDRDDISQDVFILV